MEKILKLLSYLLPLKVESVESEHNKVLEIIYENGKKILNTPGSNYSFGGLHRVFYKALQYYKLPLEKMEHILILGYGGGSIVQLIREEKRFNGNITAVEVDPAVIGLAKKHFSHLLQGVDLAEDDATRFLGQGREKYDAIFIDLFIGSKVPDRFASPAFWSLVKSRLKEEGRVMQNFICSKQEGENILKDYRRIFDKVEEIRPLGNNMVVCTG